MKRCAIFLLTFLIFSSCAKDNSDTKETYEFASCDDFSFTISYIFGQAYVWYGYTVCEGSLFKLDLKGHSIFYTRPEPMTEVGRILIRQDAYSYMENLYFQIPESLYEEEFYIKGWETWFDTGGYRVEVIRDGKAYVWVFEEQLIDIPEEYHEFVNLLKGSIEDIWKINEGLPETP